jgi:hypothetical protein
MRRPGFIIISAFVIGAMTFALAYFGAARFQARKALQPVDELAWLRTEFNLSDQEMVTVRLLHEGYLPQCDEMCQRIAAKDEELQAALKSATNMTTVVEQKLSELAALRAECQTRMLRHFFEVSRAMPPEQGRRYLAEMQRLTLGSYSRMEHSHAETPANAHGHH